ncbi:hypothetical protein MKW92_041680, partial [Papaver armeniacum]
VTDQNLDNWQKTPACVPDALRHYYYQYLSSIAEAVEAQDLKQSLELQRQELNDCRAEITSLKMHIEGSRSEKMKVLWNRISAFGERERWNVEVLLRMLTKLLPFMHQKVIET